MQPQYATAFAKLGYCLAAVGRQRDALDAYERALQIRPDFSDVHAHLSLALERLGDTQTASEYLERAFRSSAQLKNPTNAAYWHHQLGLMYCKLGDWKRAVDHLRSAVEVKPNETLVCNLAIAPVSYTHLTPRGTPDRAWLRCRCRSKCRPCQQTLHQRLGLQPRCSRCRNTDIRGRCS